MTTHGGDSADGLDLPGLGAAPLADTDPRRIGPFTLTGRLGSGGMGRVFLGVADGRFAAVKQVHPHLTEDKEFVQRFGHELDNLARLPAGVSADLLASDREAQPPWLAAGYVPGITLDEALELNGGPLPVPDVWLLLREAAAGLAAVHEIGIVHRDLKPSNVMLRQDGVTLIDFGVARALEQSRLTQSGMVIGTPSYMSPEQASSDHEVTEATDVFALGCLLGYAATGTPPYGEGSGVQMLYRIVHEQPDLEPLHAVDEELAALVAQCLAHAPQDRPTSAELVARATRHVGLGAMPWPSGVRERLAVRVQAVQRVPDVATMVMTLVPDETGAQPPAVEPVVAGGGEPEKPRRRRIRGLLIPVLVAASAGTVALVPYLMNQHGGGTPSASGSGTTSAVATVGTPSSSTSASASASHSASASASPSAAKPGASSSAHADGGATGGPSGATGSGNGDTGTSAGVNGGTHGTNGSTTAGTPGATSVGTTSGSTGTPRGSGGGVTASGTHRLRSAQDGTCLAQSPNHSTSAYLAPCASGDPFEWTYTAVSGGSFELLNPGTGECLAGSGGNFTYMVTCGSTDADVWSFGTSTSSGATLENPAAGQCLLNDTVVGGYATLSGCTGSADEVWSNY
ncbi:protein kinase domain-containing protein [Streptacidiphilus fuscans]|uniref:Protein kinase n=1 Tax=Streptacidiphilus fuscans TaxID=2789292 RepID=A0A931FB84_9ACTN|nr:protein kinase [Streptacidiphilus fuscans]MBF9067173.1 protein kinase [Streptacidiphilus fuscans]